MIGGTAGGHHETAVTQDIKDLVNNNKAAINSKLGSHATSYTVNKVWSQVVAGTMYFLHLTDDKGEKVSASIYVPLPHTNAPAEVKKAEKGHNQAKNPN